MSARVPSLSSLAVLDGAVVSLAEVPVGAFPGAFFFGAGVFETMRVEGGRVRRLRRHLARLRQSLRALPAVAAPPSVLLEEEAVAASVAAALGGAQRAGAGDTLLAKLVAADGHVLLTFRDLPAALDERWRVGVAIDALDRGGYRSGDPLANHKTLSYLRQYGRMEDAVLFLNEREEVCEGPTANVVVVVDGRCLTPPLDAPCLPGVVRGALLASPSLDPPLEVAPVPASVLVRAAACALTSAGALAVPVSRLLGRALPQSVAWAASLRRALDEAEAER